MALPEGIDVSSWQGQPDYQAVADSGRNFVFIKATQGVSYQNPTIYSGWSAAGNAGLVVGGYHYTQFERSPEAEGDYFLALFGRLGGLSEGNLLALDLEEPGQNVAEWALAFLQYVESRAGFKPIVYTSPGYAEAHNFSSLPELSQYGLWLASWGTDDPAVPDPWDFWAFHQYADNGSVPGVSGLCDLNRFNGEANRIALYGMPADHPGGSHGRRSHH